MLDCQSTKSQTTIFGPSMSDCCFHCPDCRQPLSVPAQLLGQIVQCPACTGSIQLPECLPDVGGPLRSLQPEAEPHAQNIPVDRMAKAKDGSLLVRIPEGYFEMGEDYDNYGKITYNRKTRVHLREYWIGVFCVTNRQYRKFVEATNHREPGNTKWKAKPSLDHPVTAVSWSDAKAYANWVGLTLPSEAQWEKAARGPENHIFPWGNCWYDSSCHHSQTITAGPTDVWDYPEQASGYGTNQQVGNVDEWCLDWHNSNYQYTRPWQDPVCRDIDRTEQRKGEFVKRYVRVVRGGNWLSKPQNYRGGALQAGTSGYHAQDDGCNTVGFRLVWNTP